MIRTRRVLRYPPCAIPPDLCGLHPLLARVYAHRGLHDAHSCEHPLKHLIPPDTLTGIDQAAELLADCIRDDQRTLVVGDFDADGATSSALALRALRAMGARQVDYLVPNRFEYGYGLTPEIVAVAAARKPDLIVTVDNGVSSLEGVAAARAQGMRVLVTDHHLAGAELPQADVIVNPNLPGDPFPSKHLAGVGVVFYVLAALRSSLERRGWFAARGSAAPNLARYLDLVALGTVADVVTLDHNNRVLVEQGLHRIRSGRCSPGISALLAVGGRDPRRTVASDLAFAVAPRLNAAGRLTDMSLGIECLLTDDPAQARVLALKLDALNRERREIEAGMQNEALAVLETLDAVEADGLAGVCLHDAGWHIGVVGILASRIKDRLHRPVIAFAPDTSGLLRGSARSIPGVHVRDVLDSVAAQHPGLLSRFGGHAMAAGLSLPLAHLDRFREAFDVAVRTMIAGRDLDPVVMSDGELHAADLNVETAELLRRAGPWGQGFPEPLFDGEFEVLSRRIVGDRHAKFVLRAGEDGPPIDAIAFNREDLAAGSDHLHVAYRLDVNEYGGVTRPQLVIEHLEPSVATAGNWRA